MQKVCWLGNDISSQKVMGGSGSKSKAEKDDTKRTVFIPVDTSQFSEKSVRWVRACPRFSQEGFPRTSNAHGRDAWRVFMGMPTLWIW
jgi:hypothetical protein